MSSLNYPSARIGRVAVQDGLVGFKTSAAFVSSLGANLRLDCSSPLPSPSLAPSTFPNTATKSSQLLGPILHLPAVAPLLLTTSAPQPEPKAPPEKPLRVPKPTARSRSSSGSKHSRTGSRQQQQQQQQQQQSQPQQQLDPSLPAKYRIQQATLPDARRQAVRLVARTVSWTQTLLALYSFTTHPLSLLGSLFCLLLIERCVQPAILRSFTTDLPSKHSQTPRNANNPARSISNASSRLRLANGGEHPPVGASHYQVPLTPAELTSRINQQAASLQKHAMNQARTSKPHPAHGNAMPQAWTLVAIAWLLLSLTAAAAVAWYVWRPHRRLAAEISHESWLNDEDTVLVLRDTSRSSCSPNSSDGDSEGDIVGVLILTHQSRETCSPGGPRGGGGGGQRKRRVWRGWIRAWAMRSGSRGMGLGSALLREGVRLTAAKGGNVEGVWFADDFAHAQRVLPPSLNGAFDRRDRRAKELLQALVAEALPYSSAAAAARRR